MSLSAAQLLAFKNAINGETDPAMVAARQGGADGVIAAWYAGEKAPAVSLWRPSVSVDELKNGVVWGDLTTLTAAKQWMWSSLTQGGFLDATQANIRNGFSTIFSGVSAQTLTNLTTLAQRNASRFEALFTTAGVCSLFGYAPSDGDVAQALRG